ncbi:hypothetical protein GXW82_06760 [Streptacidiphilus sp. 4-A2]|nr:hypothetical protein [Streptacidiphilus sp. 4-A2]
MADKSTTRETVVGTYFVRPGAEAEFEQVIAGNWPTLNALGFVTDDRPVVLRSLAEPPVYVEILTWEPGAMDPAHVHPDVIPIWEAVKRCTEPRPVPTDPQGFTFPAYRPVELAQ